MIDRSGNHSRIIESPIEILKVEASPQHVINSNNPLRSSVGSEKFVKLIQAEQPTIDLGITRGEFNANQLMLSIDGPIDEYRDKYEKMKLHNYELREQLDEAANVFKVQKGLIETTINQQPILQECLVSIKTLNTKLDKQSNWLDEIDFDSSAASSSFQAQKEEWASEKQNLQSENARLKQQIHDLTNRLAEMETRHKDESIDEVQVQKALMPLLESLVDPSDQIIVQDKQGRTFKIAFCEYQSEETEQ